MSLRHRGYIAEGEFIWKHGSGKKARKEWVETIEKAVIDVLEDIHPEWLKTGSIMRTILKHSGLQPLSMTYNQAQGAVRKILDRLERQGKIKSDIVPRQREWEWKLRK